MCHPQESTLMLQLKTAIPRIIYSACRSFTNLLVVYLCPNISCEFHIFQAIFPRHMFQKFRNIFTGRKDKYAEVGNFIFFFNFC